MEEEHQLGGVCEDAIDREGAVAGGHCGHTHQCPGRVDRYHAHTCRPRRYSEDRISSECLPWSSDLVMDELA